jgi:hypothetical protein
MNVWRLSEQLGEPMAEDNEFDFEALIKDQLPNQIVTGWIIIAETVGSEIKDLHVGTSEGMTTWMATGMLNCASEVILNQGYAEQDGDEE